MYNRELKLLQDVMDIKDYKRFNIRLYTIDTGNFITKGKGYFLKNSLNLEFDSFAIMTYCKNFNKEEDILTITSKDFNQTVFLANVPVKNYNHEELESVDIPRLCIMPTIEFKLGSILQSLKIKTEAIMLAQPCDKVFFSINSR